MADVSVEKQVLAFRKSVAEAHDTKHVNLLFNNAGIGGGGSLILDDREEWDKTFGVCWLGVYYCTRIFLPMLLASSEGHLINDFRNNAPHVKVSLVMPGHIGASIVINSGRLLGRDPKEMSDDDLEQARERLERMGFEAEGVSTDQIRQAMQQRAEDFRDNAPVSAAQAATIILDGVRKEQWRILVGEDAQVLDRMVRETPEEAYEASFMERLVKEANWQLGS